VVHIVVGAYFVDHYFLMFDRGVVHIVVAGYITSKSNGQQNKHPQQYEPLLCQTSKVMVNKISNHNNMNHSSVKP
jgi:hypothetical protein